MAQFLNNCLIIEKFKINNCRNCTKNAQSNLLKPGLIVFPTAMISSTPLYCTICTKGLCEDGSKTSQEKDPGHHPWWLKQYCTLDPKTVDQFLLYFPYVLLIVALTLFGIERAFNSFFKANLDKKFLKF